MSIAELAVALLIIILLLPIDVFFINSISKDFKQEMVKEIRIEEERVYKDIENTLRGKVNLISVTYPENDQTNVELQEYMNKRMFEHSSEDDIRVDGASGPLLGAVTWGTDDYINTNKMIDGYITYNSANISIQSGTDYIEVNNRSHKVEKSVNTINYYTHLETDMTRRLLAYLDGKSDNVLSLAVLPELTGVIDHKTGELTYKGDNPLIVFLGNNELLLVTIDRVQYNPRMNIIYSIYKLEYDPATFDRTTENTSIIRSVLRLEYK